MPKIYLIRHGETTWNRSGHYQGLTDVPLNDRGIAQAELCAKALADVPVTRIVCSDLSRARITAERIASYHPTADFQVDARLREIHFGDWEGLTYEEISARWPGSVEKMYEDAGHATIPGGENFAQVQTRAWEAVSLALEGLMDTDILFVVCHGGVTRTLICKILGISLSHAWNFRQGNTSISILNYYGEGIFNTLELLNDTSHTRELEGEDLCG